MHLSSTQTKALGDVMRLLADATDADKLRASLGLPILELLSADTYVSMVWSEYQQRFERFTALNMSADSLRGWDEYYRFIDPLTFPMLERRKPTIATQILPQSELSRTEFFCDFLRPERMHWGINVYFHHQHKSVGDFRVWRCREKGNFENNEVELLKMIEPAVAAALARLNWEVEQAPSVNASERAEEFLQRYTRLSQREAEVAWLVACGCPDKQIAKRLNVEHPTVRFHLTNAFRKLQATNRVTLASRVNLLLEGKEHTNTLN
jgi:DNA-binding CsgD family transcriptional regulator